MSDRVRKVVAGCVGLVAVLFSVACVGLAVLLSFVVLEPTRNIIADWPISKDAWILTWGVVCCGVVLCVMFMYSAAFDSPQSTPSRSSRVRSSGRGYSPPSFENSDGSINWEEVRRQEFKRTHDFEDDERF